MRSLLELLPPLELEGQRAIGHHGLTTVVIFEDGTAALDHSGRVVECENLLALARQLYPLVSLCPIADAPHVGPILSADMYDALLVETRRCLLCGSNFQVQYAPSGWGEEHKRRKDHTHG